MVGFNLYLFRFVVVLFDLVVVISRGCLLVIMMYLWLGLWVEMFCLAGFLMFAWVFFGFVLVVIDDFLPNAFPVVTVYVLALLHLDAAMGFTNLELSFGFCFCVNGLWLLRFRYLGCLFCEFWVGLLIGFDSVLNLCCVFNGCFRLFRLGLLLRWLGRVCFIGLLYDSLRIVLGLLS